MNPDEEYPVFDESITKEIEDNNICPVCGFELCSFCKNCVYCEACTCND